MMFKNGFWIVSKGNEVFTSSDFKSAFLFYIGLPPCSGDEEFKMWLKGKR